MRPEHGACSANELRRGERNDPQWAFYSLSEWNFEAFMFGINDEEHPEINTSDPLWLILGFFFLTLKLQPGHSDCSHES